MTPQASDRDAKSGIPDIDEWMNFFSRIVVRLAMDWYIDWAFRGIDENILTDRDIDNIKMTTKERDRIARPFAEFCVKNKYTRKHGRTIIATGDSIDAVIQLGMWYNRVNRIASRYRSGPPPQHSHSGSDITRHFERQEARNAAAAENRENRRERTDESAPAPREAGWRPAIGGEVIRTDLG